MSLSHDATAAITNNQGSVLGAIAEERLTRIKNHTGIPLLAMRALMDNLGSVSKIVIGTHATLSSQDAARLVAQENEVPSSPRGKWPSYTYPGFRMSKSVPTQNVIENLILKEFPDLVGIPFVWTNHHDGHIGSALGMVNQAKSALLVSLDGQGDGESGAISIWNSGQMRNLNRYSYLDSLGELYSAVTRRYNFKAMQHEGKITGLAAFGSNSGAIEILKRFISVDRGNLRILRTDNLKKRLVGKTLRGMGLNSRVGLTLEEIVSMAEEGTNSYPDLAHAVQKVLEDSVLEIVGFYCKETNTKTLSLSGGVFSNVRLNQRISEMPEVEDVKIFPNMGDGGISLGGIWTHLQSTQSLSKDGLFEDMYLAPPSFTDDEELKRIIQSEQFNVREFSEVSSLSCYIAEQIASKKIVALHKSRMEFGPRALCNRSLLADPRDSEVNQILNKRLKRTEFMPFAPVVRIEDFDEYFDISKSQSLIPFFYMTMTASVKSRVSSRIPAVVHVDGTARPQIVSKESNEFVHNLLMEFGKISGVSVLINTSLNLHEEPINYSLEDSINGLLKSAFDTLVYESFVISLR